MGDARDQKKKKDLWWILWVAVPLIVIVLVVLIVCLCTCHSHSKPLKELEHLNKMYGRVCTQKALEKMAPECVRGGWGSEGCQNIRNQHASFCNSLSAVQSQRQNLMAALQQRVAELTRK